MGCHGRLRSTCVTLDARLQCKIADYGLPLLRTALSQRGGSVRSAELLWTAPEVLSQQVERTPPGDVWSLGVLFSEILTRLPPQMQWHRTPDEIVLALSDETRSWRPTLAKRYASTPIGKLTRRMLAWVPDERPSLSVVKSSVMRAMRCGCFVTRFQYK